MDFEKLLDSIARLDKYLLEQAKSDSQKERILARTVKLNEEVGELCAEVLAHGNDQRQDKLEVHNPENLSLEFADVIITTLVLAKAMNVDVKEALAKKIDKRFEKQS